MTDREPVRQASKMWPGSLPLRHVAMTVCCFLCASCHSGPLERSCSSRLNDACLAAPLAQPSSETPPGSNKSTEDQNIPVQRRNWGQRQISWATGQSEETGVITATRAKGANWPDAVEEKHDECYHTVHEVALRFKEGSTPSGQSDLDSADPPKDGLASTEPVAPGYTLEDLIERALANNPAIAQAQAQLDAARGQFIQVGLPPNPAVGYSGQQLGSRGLAEQQGVFIEQNLIMGGKLQVQRHEAAWLVRQAEQRLLIAERRVVTDVQTAFYDLLIAQQRVALAEQLYRIARQALETVNSLYNAQEATATDLLQAQIEADTAHVFVENAQAERQGAWQRLAAVVGQPDLPLGVAVGNVEDSVPEHVFDELASQLQADHPQLAAQQAAVERARWAVERAYRAVIPDINVQGIIQDDRATQSSNGTLQVSVPVPIWNRNQGGIRQAWGELAAAEQAVDRTALALRRRLADVFQDYQVARQQTLRYREQILPNAEKSLRLINEGYKAGEFSYLQLLTAQRTYFQTQLAYLDALRRAWSGHWQLEGLLISGSLEADP